MSNLSDIVNQTQPSKTNAIKTLNHFGKNPFDFTFEYNNDLLKDHVIFGEQVLMGMAHISLGIEYIRKNSSLTNFTIKKVSFSKALIFSKGEKAVVSIQEIARKDDAISLVSRSQTSLGAQAQLASFQWTLLDTSPYFSQLDIAALKQTSSATIIAKEAFYEHPQQNWYGPSLFSVIAVDKLNDTEALAEIKLTESVLQKQDCYYIHPALLDACHVASTLSLAGNPIQNHRIPVLVKAVHVSTTLDTANFSHSYCYIKRKILNEEIIEFDISLCDEQGQCYLMLEGFTTKRVLNKEALLAGNDSTESLNAKPLTALHGNFEGDIETFIRTIIAAKLKKQLNEVSVDENFMNLGLDSTHMISVVKEIEVLGIELYPTLLFEYQNIKALSDYLTAEYTKNKIHTFNRTDISPAEVKASAATIVENTKPAANKEVIKEIIAKPPRQPINFATGTFQTKVLKSNDCDIAIIGMSGVMPQSNNLEEFWQYILASTDLVTEIPKTRWDYEKWFDTNRDAVNKTYSKWGSFLNDVDKFDPAFFGISPRQAIWIDPQLRLFLQSAYHTFEDAGLVDQIKGSNTSVYVGSCFHEYWDEIVRSHFQLKDYQHNSSAMSSLSGFVSYIFDLQGGSVPLDNACASSLTALHLGVEAIKRGECDMSLIGGLNVLLSPLHYVYFSRIQALSPTGRCHTFDEKADGYVPGEGIVSVLIKRLDKAIEDGDNIHAVIKSTAINHVGRSNNPTSPRPELQTKLLISAWEKAKINPEDISYIEAHGTGTKLGDPIEINALKNAFKQYTQKANFCILGSTKAHIGHLEGAAGLASLLKVILMMKHQKIPKMPNFTQQSSFIDLKDSPFSINTDSLDWTVHAGKKRLAGISSFGMTGNNAHAVIEEAPELQTMANNKPFYIVTLSAKTASALIQRKKDLLHWLSMPSNETIPLSAVSYTLNLGRTHFEYRAAWVVADKQSLRMQLNYMLEGKQSDDGFAGVVDKNHRPDDHAIYLAVLDHLLSQLQHENLNDANQYLKNLRALANLYIKGYAIDWALLYKEGIRQRISLPVYPFAKERYWMTDSDYDHAMLQEASPSDKLHPLIHKNVSDLTEQSFETLLHADAFYLQDHVIAGQKLLPGVAYLEMARAAGSLSLKDEAVVGLEQIVWSQPIAVEREACVQIAFYPDEKGITFEVRQSGRDESVVHAQGKLITKTMAVDNLAKAVETRDNIEKRCAKTLHAKEIYQHLQSIGLQYGPSFQTLQWLKIGEGEALGYLSLSDDLARANDRSAYVLHPALLDGALHGVAGLVLSEGTQSMLVPFSLEQILIADTLPDQCYIHVRKQQVQTQFPSYAINLLDDKGIIYVQMSGFVARAIHQDVLESNATLGFYAPLWEASPLSNENSAFDLRHALVFCDDNEQFFALKQQLVTQYPRIKLVQVQSGEAYNFVNELTYQIKPGNAVDYEALFQALTVHEGESFDIIVDLWNVTTADGSFPHPLEHYTSRNSNHLLALSQAWLKHKQTSLRYLHLYPRHESKLSFDEMQAGFARSIAQEHAGYDYRIIGVNEQDYTPEHLAWIIKYEWSATSDAKFIRYDQSHRFVERIQAVNLDQCPQSKICLREKGVYLITGGLGGLGLIFAKHLAQHYQAKLVLTGRTALDDAMQQQLDELKTLGAEVEYVAGDVTQAQEVDKIIKAAKTASGAINGIIHAAGVLRDSLISQKTADEMQAVLKPKVDGTVYLDRYTRQEKTLEFFVVFSSLASLLGNIGQSDYASANAFMDGFVRYRNVLQDKGERYGRSVSIHWPLWADGGMQITESEQKRLFTTFGMKLLSKEDGIDAFKRILNSELVQSIPLFGKQSTFQKLLKPSVKKLKVTNTNAVTDELRAQVLATILAHTKSILKIEVDNIDEHEDLTDYGFDSIGFTEFSNAINKTYHLNITPTVFFDYSSLASLTDYLLTSYLDDLVKVHQPVSNFIEATDENNSVVDAVENNANTDNFTSQNLPSYRINKQYSKDVPDIRQKDKVDVAIVGMSGAFPGAKNLDEFWQNISAGKDCITEIPEHRWSWKTIYGDSAKELNKSNVKWGGFISDVDKFDSLFFKISHKEAILLDPVQRLILLHTYQAIEDAGYNPEALSNSNVGVFIAAANSGYQELLIRAGVPIEEFASTGLPVSVTANRVSYIMNLNGPSELVDTACSSSLVALHRAIAAIEAGECDSAVVGGINLLLTPYFNIAFNKAGMLCEDGRCKTFSNKANGYVRGEGVGVIYIKKMTDALKDKDSIYAVLKGSAVNHCGKSTSLTAPNPSMQSAVIKKALNKANILPETITYIEAHGTGTHLGDPIEIDGLKMAFAKSIEENKEQELDQPKCGIGSVKTNIGHLEMAAGMAGLMKVILAMKHQTIPASIHCDEVNPYIDLNGTGFYIAKNQENWQQLRNKQGKLIPRRAGISSFGFGGVNAHVILEEYTPELTVDNNYIPHDSNYFIPISAQDEMQLYAYVAKLLSWLQSNMENNAITNQDLFAISATLQLGRKQQPHRIGFYVKTVDDFINKLKQIMNKEQHSDIFVGKVDKKNSSSALESENINSIFDSWKTHKNVQFDKYIIASFKRMHLPTYAFKQITCWYTELLDKYKDKSVNIEKAAESYVDSLITNMSIGRTASSVEHKRKMLKRKMTELTE